MLEKKTHVFLMIHISQEELLKKIEREHQQPSTENAEGGPIESTSSQQKDMSSDLSATCGNLKDKNNNIPSSSGDEDEVKAVLITGK